MRVKRTANHTRITMLKLKQHGDMEEVIELEE